MSSAKSATPYAKALFEVAAAAGQAEVVGGQLGELADLTAANAELQRALTRPAIPPRVKRQLIERLAAEAGYAAPLQRLLSLMADRDRLALLPQLQAAYQARLMQHLGVVEAQITTALPLPAERATALAQSLSRATGQEVRMTTTVDPSILGGVVARMGSKVFDGSVAHQLDKMREHLEADAALLKG